MSVLVQFRRGTAAQWTSNNPMLAAGEPGFESNTGKYKIGDGTTAWNSLAYQTLQPNVTAFTLPSVATPAAPAAGNLTVFGQAIGGRMMLRQIGPSGLDTAFQPFLARNKVGYWCPPGNATTVPGIYGYPLPSTAGTVTARNVATTNMFTRMRRLGYVSASGAGSVASWHHPVTLFTLGDGVNGGFYKVMRFGISDAATVAGARSFCGVSTATATPTNINPLTIVNQIGVAHDAADSNWKFVAHGSVAQTPVDLGANFPCNTLSADVYELAMFAPPVGGLFWEFTRLNTGHVATGYLPDGGSVTTPSSTTLLGQARFWRTNNATALSVGIDIMSDYIETDI